ncbi:MULTISPECIES: SsgA family sporulation/cell division regulator [Streptomyces]|uniref:SsgA family sporulation/cell division regulator n=1 Tax=Streptomyces flaveolus TaxID=67297 RepID=A0ABV3AN09_9ACTN|nr:MULTISPECIES: SsgA family sporulation/cell division regulator [Streptomyces]MBG7702623.1 SsgA family sporulation/cell division regulator [Streptomyces sp. MC1]
MSHHSPHRPGPASSPRPGASCRCEGTVLLDGSVTVPVTLSFHYAADEPYAVRMVVDSGVTPPVEWVFARDLLAEGLSRPAGLGDVQTWPAPRRPQQMRAGRGALCIRISSPTGTTIVSAPATALRRFLDRAYGSVAAGTESGMLRLDESLAGLMRGTGRRTE